MAKKIPEEITTQEFNALRGILEQFMNYTTASQVSMRLNESSEEDHNFSYFVGFVQNLSATQTRQALGIPDPGLFRFGDDVPSKEYRDTIKATMDYFANVTGSPFVERDWATPPVGNTNFKKKSMGSKGIDNQTGVLYRLYIGIVVDGIVEDSSTVRRCVGMLGVGFSSKADADGAQSGNLQTIVKDWAQAAGNASGLVTYLRDTFELGGPIV